MKMFIRAKSWCLSKKLRIIKSEESYVAIDIAVCLCIVDDKRLPVISDRRHISPNFQQSRERHEDRVKSPPVAPVVSTVELSIAVTSEMSPVMQVLVYYVRGDSEMVADTIKLPVEHCFENKVFVVE